MRTGTLPEETAHTEVEIWRGDYAITPPSTDPKRWPDQERISRPKGKRRKKKKKKKKLCPISTSRSASSIRSSRGTFPFNQPIRVLAANLYGRQWLRAEARQHPCTGSGLRLRELCIEAGLPRDLFQVIVIDHDTSDRLIAHPMVRGVTLTGSDQAGRHVGACRCEGAQEDRARAWIGMDAYLVLETRTSRRRVKFSVMGRLYNNGETCISAKRFIVTDKVYHAIRRCPSWRR